MEQILKLLHLEKGNQWELEESHTKRNSALMEFLQMVKILNLGSVLVIAIRFFSRFIPAIMFVNLVPKQTMQ
jgi:hypothetical protein